MKAACAVKYGVASSPSGGPSAPGGRYPPEAPAEGCGARETWGPGSALSPYGLLASTPHIAAAPLIMLLACGQAGGLADGGKERYLNV